MIEASWLGRTAFAPGMPGGYGRLDGPGDARQIVDRLQKSPLTPTLSPKRCLGEREQSPASATARTR